MPPRPTVLTPSPVSVITSYSIHYTKLYDAGELGDLAAEIEQVSAELSRTELELEHRLKELAAAREDSIIREQVLDAARNDVARLRHDRITSYNVCYTKLLRIPSAGSR